MKLFRRLTFAGLNNKVKALKPNLNFESCIPLTADQLSFRKSTPSEKGVVIVRSSPGGRTNIPRKTATFHLERPFPPFRQAEPAVTSWFPPILHQDDESECSVMVLNRDTDIEEHGLDAQEMDDAEYRYHYTLRRARQLGEDTEEELSHSADRKAQHYSRLRDSGLISTSFDEYQPTSGSEAEVEAQRHPKMNVIFDWSDGDGLGQWERDLEPGAIHDKYAEEEERASKELFMDAGLWSNKAHPADSPNSGTLEFSNSRADTAFYIHQNLSMFHLPSADSDSTNIFSQKHLSPHFVELEGGISSCGSVTTEDDLQSISKLSYNNFASTPTPTTAQVSPGAPPNTPWNPNTPDVQLVSRSGLEASSRRRGGQKQDEGSNEPSEGRKLGFEADYSFISFSSPIRVSLAPITDANPVQRATLSGAVKTRFNKAFEIEPEKSQLLSIRSTPELKAASLSEQPMVSSTPPTKQVAAGSPQAGLVLSNFGQDLNEALDVLECLVDQGGVGPTLAYTFTHCPVPTESIYSDPEDTRSKFTCSPGFGSPLSRFSVSTTFGFGLLVPFELTGHSNDLSIRKNSPNLIKGHGNPATSVEYTEQAEANYQLPGGGAVAFLGGNGTKSACILRNTSEKSLSYILFSTRSTEPSLGGDRSPDMRLSMPGAYGFDDPEEHAPGRNDYTKEIGIRNSFSMITRMNSLLFG